VIRAHCSGPVFCALVAVVSAVSCRANDGERLGDQAYAEGRFTQALEQYRAVLQKNPDGRIWAKAGAAALHTGDLDVAANAYLRLAAEDPTRSAEAAEGLDGVARAAERAGDARRLQTAVVGMEAIAPDRSIGRYALNLVRRPGAEASDLVSVLPGAIAAAPDQETVDSLLVVYAGAVRETSGCEQALPLFQAAVRRTKIAGLFNRAEEGVAFCSLALGFRAEAVGKFQDALLWYAAAIKIDSSTNIGRRALVGYGDARLRLGDTLAGALAYQAVASDPVQTDTTHQMAAARLAQLQGVLLEPSRTNPQ
jgi:tetratricopeptide (TPR) repeat protein